MNQIWISMMLAALLFGMISLNAHNSRLLSRAWRRERETNKAFDDLIKAHENHTRALQELIDILEGWLRERGVNI